jgi:hypothetical protein
VAYHLPSAGPSAFPVFDYWKFMWRSAPCLSPLLQCAQSTLPPLLHVPFQFLVCYSVLFCFVVVGVSLSKRLCWFIPSVAVGIPRATYLLTCCSASPRQVWSQSLVAWEPSYFSV